MKNWFKVLGVGCLVLAIAGCNTVEGIGRDIETAGDTIEKTANDNK